MPKVITEISLPPLNSERPKSRYHDLFVKVTDGQLWLVEKSEFAVQTPIFQLALGNWARTRNMVVKTRTTKTGDLYVKRILGNVNQG